MTLNQKGGITLFTKFKKSNSVIFLDPHAQIAPKIAESTRVDIILSPSLYWVKKLKLPVKYTRDVKKLLPSIFEDILPNGNYSYAVFKEDDGYIAFAYEDKQIIDELTKQKIPVVNVENVYFAQTELLSSSPCMINDKEALVLENGVLFLAPLDWFEDIKPLSLSSVIRSNKAIKLQQYSHIIDTGSINKIGALLGVFIVVLIVEMFITSQKIDHLEQEKEKLFTHAKLLPTMMQNRAVLAEYETTFEKQTKLRNILGILLQIELRQKITKIELKNKVLHITLQEIDQATTKKILQSLKAYESTLRSSLKNNSFEIEVVL